MTNLVKNYIKTIVIMIITITVIFIVSKVLFGTGNPLYIVSSGSMIPALNIDDVIIVQENSQFDKIKVGDVIAFSSPNDHNEIIVHRVAQILTQNPYEIRTKGDANPDSIQGIDLPITKHDFIGKVVYVIPHIGYLTHILNPPINYVVAVTIMGVMVAKSSSMQKRRIF